MEQQERKEKVHFHGRQVPMKKKTRGLSSRVFSKYVDSTRSVLRGEVTNGSTENLVRTAFSLECRDV